LATSPVVPSIPLGDDVVIPVAFKNADGTPFDLTGGSAKAAIRSLSGVTPAVLIVKTSTPSVGILITNALGGLANITLDSIDTVNIAAGQYEFSAQAINGAGKKSTQIITKIPFIDHPTR
jgi:hypothetical protein